MPQRILLVEDEPTIAKLISMALRRAGYEPILAGNGPEALRLARHEQPDLILLDVMLPGMDGYQICRHLRNDPDTRGLPVMMLTAMSRPADQRIGFDAGADDYVTKPVVISELLQHVRSLFFFAK